MSSNWEHKDKKNLPLRQVFLRVQAGAMFRQQTEPRGG
jgi:hypothetical protein